MLPLEPVKPWQDVVLDLKRIDGLNESAGGRLAILTLRAWEGARLHIDQRIPRSLASADDPHAALAQMTQKMNALQRTGLSKFSFRKRRVSLPLR